MPPEHDAGPTKSRTREEGHETSIDRRSASRRSGREHDETGGGPLGLGLGMGARRIRHRCADWRGVVAAGLLLLLSGLRLPRVWLWLWDSAAIVIHHACWR